MSVRTLVWFALVVGCSQSAVALRTGDAGPDAPPLIPPLCNGADAARLGSLGENPCPTIGGWSVAASGGFTYTGPGLCGDDAPAADVRGSLASVDLDASTFTLSTGSGAVVVHVSPVQPDWLSSLPLGDDLSAHFENGVVLREATSTALLLAVVTNLSYHAPDFAIDPIHVTGGGTRCVEVTPAPAPCDPGAYHIHSQLDTAFALGTTSVVAIAGHGPVSLADATDAFEVDLLGSIVQGGVTAGDLPECDTALIGGTWIAIGRPAS